jgi:capsular polysaccharide biosynthesis protein
MPYLVEPKSFSKEIVFKQPMNMHSHWSHLFKPDNMFLNVKLGARILHNVFLNHYGLVIKNGLLVKGCAPNIGDTKYNDENFYWTHWKKATEQRLVSKYGSSIPSMRLDDNKYYLVIHSPWFSYYFWLTECLPRLLMVQEHHKNLILIVPEQWKKFSFVCETLKLFPDLEKIEIPRDTHLWVKNLVLPEVKPWTPMFIPEHVFQVRDFLFDHFNIQSDKTSNHNTYISRKTAQRRKFTQEEYVELFLKDYGFNAVSMEELSFQDQISIMSNSNNTAAITGAGLVNLLFKKRGGVFIDFTNIEYLTKDQYKFHYLKLCNILDIDYNVCFFEHENSSDTDHYSNQNLIFNAREVKKILNKIQKK